MRTTLLPWLRAQWDGLTPGRRLALGLVLLGLVGTVALWLFLSTQVPYEVAFSDLKPDEAAAIANKLKELQIPYQIDSNSNIRVPATMLAEARVQVAGAGLLRGGVGFEIFDQPSFGLSDFVQKVNYQRALEGELARSIEQLEPVASARVHLAIPQPSVFVRDQRDPSAAVVIDLKPGYTLTRSQGQAIVDLVVGAVEGMKPSQVVLLDTRGQLLHQTEDSPASDPAGVSDQYATERAMEQDLAARLQDMLDRVVGPGRSSVQVNLQLDWSTGEATNEIYSPNGLQPQIRTDQEVHEVQAAGTPVGGVPGVTSNVPTYQQVTPTMVPGAASERTESNRSYELSRTVEKIQRAPGTIKRLSASVAVDSSAVNPATLANITQMVQAAVGYDPNRGDVVTVVPVPLKQIQSAGQAAAVSRQEQILELARTIGLIVGPALAVLILALLLLRRRGARTIPAVRTIPVPAVPPPELEAEEIAAGTRPALAAQRSHVRTQLVEVAQKDPALVASILQAWMAEDRGNRR